VLRGAGYSRRRLIRFGERARYEPSAAPRSASRKRADWWSTAIIDIEPGKIAIRGYPIQELIGTLSFPAMVWLMLRGEVPEPRRRACSKRRSSPRSTTARTRRRSRSPGWRSLAACR
jgi:citrate synthase